MKRISALREHARRNPVRPVPPLGHARIAQRRALGLRWRALVGVEHGFPYDEDAYVAARVLREDLAECGAPARKCVTWARPPTI